MFHAGVLDSRIIRYSIVNENGASIYSCSDVAAKEFPKMDTNERSAGLDEDQIKSNTNKNILYSVHSASFERSIE